MTSVEFVLGSITAVDVDAVVNAANVRLSDGSGVSGAIHRASGPELAAACAKLGGCETGCAKVTAGFRLRAKWIIHAVGPVFGACSGREEELLASCHLASLARADEVGVKSIAFPAISTGSYGYPPDLAAPVAVKAVADAIAQGRTNVDRIVFAFLFDREREPYRNAWRSVTGL